MCVIALSGLLFFYSLSVYCQQYDSLSVSKVSENISYRIFSGFVRAGLYTWADKQDDRLNFSSAYSDAALKIQAGNNHNFNALADVRFRYGSEFQSPVNNVDIREAYVTVNGSRWDFSAGQKIIKWGRCDFTNTVSKFSPQNMLSRSPDREDIDLGNLLAAFNWHPAGIISLKTVFVPYYRSSVLIIRPVTLPEYVTLEEINSLMTGKKLFSYGLKADIHLKGIDWSISWFDGIDPMPGVGLKQFSVDISQPVPVPSMMLAMRPFRNRIVGSDFEAVAGQFGLRGEVAWSQPELSGSSNEFVPLPEIKWVFGLDWSYGNFRLTGEYTGKLITDFINNTAIPVIGTEYDPSDFAALLSMPFSDVEQYVQQQVAAFNRLYNYQLEKSYHSAGIRAEADMLYGKLLPSMFGSYNFTSHDLLFIPEIRYKPSDGLTVTAGAEIYSGRKGSLYDLVDEFMNSVFLSFRVDF